VKILIRIGIVLAAIVALFFLLNILPRPKSVQENKFIVGKGRPLLIAHGGGNKEFPDNTLEAFYNAYSIDPRVMMETDVNMTKDGVIILSHDSTLDRKTNVSGDIIDWNYSDLMLEEVDFGFHNPTSSGYKSYQNLVPFRTETGRTVTPLNVAYPARVSARHPYKFLATTLEELIIAFPNNAINVEIKQSGDIGLKALDAVIELMSRLDSGYNTYSRLVLASFHKEIYDQIKEYHKKDPRIMFSPNVDGAIMLYATHWFGLDFIYNEPVTVLQIPPKQGPLPLNWRHFINAAHKHNIAVHYWTINDEQEMRTLIKNGADGIMSDLPTLLKRVLDDMYGPQ
jgi:glycerophosphoryl diester phosphodiesterase